MTLGFAVFMVEALLTYQAPLLASLPRCGTAEGAELWLGCCSYGRSRVWREGALEGTGSLREVGKRAHYSAASHGMDRTG